MANKQKEGPLTVDSEVIEEIEDLHHKVSKQLPDITDDKTFQTYAFMLKDVKLLTNEVEDLFSDSVKEANAVHKALTSQRKKILTPLEECDKILRSGMNVYASRIQMRFQDDRAEAHAKLIEEEESRFMEQLAVLRERGEEEQAEELERLGFNPEDVPEPYVPEPETPEGVSFRRTYTFEVVDIDKIPKEFLTVDVKKVGDLVKAMKFDAMNIVPGIKVIEKSSVAVTVER